MSQPPRPDGPWHPQGPSSHVRGQQPGPWRGPQQPGPQQPGPQQPGLQQPGPQQMVPQRPGQPGRPGPVARGPRRPVGPLLMIVGAVAAVVGALLPWNHGRRVVRDAGGLRFQRGEAWNGIQQAVVNINNDRIYGWLMIIAFVLTALACLLCVAMAVVALTSSGGGTVGALALVGALLGLLGTLGVFVGYAALGALDESEYGMWVYAASFLPTLVGSIGVLSRKF